MGEEGLEREDCCGWNDGQDAAEETVYRSEELQLVSRPDWQNVVGGCGQRGSILLRNDISEDAGVGCEVQYRLSGSLQS